MTMGYSLLYLLSLSLFLSPSMELYACCISSLGCFPLDVCYFVCCFSLFAVLFVHRKVQLSAKGCQVYFTLPAMFQYLCACQGPHVASALVVRLFLSTPPRPKACRSKVNKTSPERTFVSIVWYGGQWAMYGHTCSQLVLLPSVLLEEVQVAWVAKFSLQSC